MEPKLKTMQVLSVNVHEKEFQLMLPAELNIYEGYQACMTMANVFMENIIKEKKALEEKAEENKPKEEESKIEELPEEE